MAVLVDLGALPANFPTHRHEAVFWEKVGRTVATFGFLEEVLGKATFAFTVRKQHAASESEEAFEAWLEKPEGLEGALMDPLTGLIDRLARAVEEYSNARSPGSKTCSAASERRRGYATSCAMDLGVAQTKRELQNRSLLNGRGRCSRRRSTVNISIESVGM